MLEHWMLDPKSIYLNHGTVGAPPKRVLIKQQQIRDEIEQHPAMFLFRKLGHNNGLKENAKYYLRDSAAIMADFMGAKGEDLVFVDNATSGCNAVLRSLTFKPGDTILTTDIAYGAITLAAKYVARRFGATVKEAVTPYPATSDEIADAIIDSIDNTTRLLILDHITAETSLILPVAKIAKRAKVKGVRVLIDGAHVPGSIPLDISSLDVDWYTGNFHKWAWAPRSSAFLWASQESQQDLHPTVISWGLDKGFTEEFDWVGTRDWTPFLAAPEGIAFMAELGMDAVREYNHKLAWEGAHMICDRIGTTFEADQAMTGCMATFPLPEQFGSTHDEAARLRDALLFEDNIEVQLHSWRGKLWVRISAQIYNDMEDMNALANAICKRM
jgi:isopenicillin-N epimerase